MALIPEQQAKLTEYVKTFHVRYLETPQGREHLAAYDRERQEVQAVYTDIKQKRDAGYAITDDVLYRLLPHKDTKYNQEHEHRVSTWPAITKDIKMWHEGAGWQTPENWPKVANAIFDLVEACSEGPSQSDFEHFSGLDFIKGFEAGMLSPIFYCLNSDLLVINNKTRDTVNFLYDLLGHPERIDRYLINYLDNITFIRKLLDVIEVSLFDDYRHFDMFCHFMCDKQLGGYARQKKTPPPPVEPPVPVEEAGTAKERRTHDEVQWMLIELGTNLGCDVWVARNDQGKSIRGNVFSDHTLARLPRLGFDQETTRIIEFIDVLWLKGNAIVAAFEIEHTTSIYSGILRLSDLVTMQPNVNIDLFIVAPEARRDKAIRELNRPTFSSYSLRLHERCKFLSYDKIDQILQDTASYAGYVDARVIKKVAESCEISDG